MNTPNDPKGAVGALKTPLGLIPSYAMEQTAWVHKLGSDKYGPFNWRKTGVCASTYVNAILRHLNAWRDGETVDPESGISHLAHVACSCNILLDAGFCGTLQDDRNITPPNTPVSKMDKPTPIKYTPTNPLIVKIDKPTPINYTLRQPLIGTGYRRLEDGEAFMEGDEVYDEYDDLWVPVISWSGKICCWKDLARRKVEPVEEPTPIPYTEYRRLKEGEIIQEGDEFLCPLLNEWECTKRVGCSNKCGLTYRRKVEASNEPEQPVEVEYRLLKVGELIEEGDEHCDKVHLKWHPVRNGVGKKVRSHFNDHRRKVEASNEPELCTCGRIKINHFMLGLICEDCEIQWQDPY